jgi:hypothetical protein
MVLRCIGECGDLERERERRWWVAWRGLHGAVRVADGG